MVKKENSRISILKKYLLQYPMLPTLTLAKLVYKKHPEYWVNIETTRSNIRYYRGQNGEASRRELQDRRFVRELEKNYNPFNLPESDEKEREPVKIPFKYKKILILSDIHIPYHNMRALSTMIAFAKNYSPDLVLFNGDVMDCHLLSKFEKDPGARSFAQELYLTKKFFDRIISDLLPDADFIWKLGNHEERYQKFMRVKAPELIDIQGFTFEDYFQEYGMMFIKDKRRVIIADHLLVMHGHEIAKSGGFNPAKTLFNKSKQTSICSHFHRTAEHTENRLDGTVISTWSIGCLCERSPDFSPYNNWNHGFAIVDVNGSHDYQVQNKKIINNKVV